MALELTFKLVIFTKVAKSDVAVIFANTVAPLTFKVFNFVPLVITRHVPEIDLNVDSLTTVNLFKVAESVTVIVLKVADENDETPSTVRFSPINTLSATPIPPAVIIDPVFADVESEVDVPNILLKDPFPDAVIVFAFTLVIDNEVPVIVENVDAPDTVIPVAIIWDNVDVPVELIVERFAVFTVTVSAITLAKVANSVTSNDARVAVPETVKSPTIEEYSNDVGPATFKDPPMYTFLAIPTPPVVTKLPVEIELESTSDAM